MSALPRDDLRRAFAHLVTLIDSGPDAAPADLVAAARRGLDRYGDVTPRAPISGVRIDGVDAGGVRAAWVRAPNADPARRIVYLHGGGYIGGSLHSHEALVARLAALTGCAILQVDYRLAPEHLFPIAHNDCMAAFAWATTHGPDGAAPADALFVIGDSVGGALAAAVCADAIERRARAPDKLALIGPTLDITSDFTRPACASDPFVNAEVVAAIGLYSGDAPSAHPYLSPLRLPEATLAYFPPTLLQASGAEYLLPDTMAFAARLAASQRRVQIGVWPDMPHVWHLFLTLLPESDAALREIAHFIRQDDAL